MKNPLHYQISECDCGPTSMLNAVSYLFEREEIPPEIIRLLQCGRNSLQERNLPDGDDVFVQLVK